jgi:hypothetical protein
MDNVILVQGLIKLIVYLYKQGASSFLEAYLKRTSRLSMLGLEKTWMGDRPGSFLGSARVRTKCAKRLVLVCGDGLSSYRAARSKYRWSGIGRGVT